ncbi:2-amino-4-hydroxy-6-hydroxymethyldihydropteridine diphosphokinase [Imperialibacter roseus]|uniref:2-amino-4-hydroxy-6-hydroxymethyldihydropteridine pyrophosphokinase n=1 Tax=Imperialibacter roseus TaxID=1324217 RepID=A0ABZ0IIV9_9BACT|nr:2-amino-4-hydroxy-6-hydroxymethyldihydropteridine diphosphokinase [Imperialibacter roseus]WOK04965.1 2-amino-4-hydroxy-6-hydroxymethyldihydropteridine diphosphokinase [Imperialibacter roseus]
MGIFLLLGSNQGDRLATLLEAGRMINERIGQMVRSSSIYATQAWGQTEQADFLNQVIEIESSLRAEEVLHQALEIEKHLGRQRIEKWGPRVIDIDILYVGNEVIKTDNLVVPHPQIPFRRFTLAPLTEIAPEFIHPTLGKNQAQLLSECADPLEVTKLSDATAAT